MERFFSTTVGSYIALLATYIPDVNPIMDVANTVRPNERTSVKAIVRKRRLNSQEF
jgi:hypothetical protein